MVYDEIKLLRQSEKSTVQLVKEQGSERLFVRKILQGRHQVYAVLRELTHPYLRWYMRLLLRAAARLLWRSILRDERRAAQRLRKNSVL